MGELNERFKSLEDEELIRTVSEEYEEYTPEALDVAILELQSRGIKIDFTEEYLAKMKKIKEENCHKEKNESLSKLAIIFALCPILVLSLVKLYELYDVYNIDILILIYLLIILLPIVNIIGTVLGITGKNKMGKIAAVVNAIELVFTTYYSVYFCLLILSGR